jgi:hypothetical protein
MLQAAQNNQAKTTANLPKSKLSQLVQPKLEINSPGDAYEHEADAMADKVARMGNTQTPVKPVTGLIGSSVQRKCSDCEEEEKSKMPLMRKAQGGGYSASPALVSQLGSSKGSGNPLPKVTRNFMERAFSTDFAKVRIHTGSEAAKMSQGISAKAFTHGSDIYFNQGQYDPHSPAGKHLLAHELTHVVQQGDGVAPKLIQRKDNVSGPTTSGSKEIASNNAGALFQNGDDYIIRLDQIKLKSYAYKAYVNKLMGKGHVFHRSKEARNTHQDTAWKSAAKIDAVDFEQLYQAPGKTVLDLRLKNGKGDTVNGTIEKIKEQVTRPFWNASGDPQKYDIEHAVDWQVVGDNDIVDDAGNLMLLDMSTNRSLGSTVNQSIITSADSIIEKYNSSLSGRDKKLPMAKSKIKDENAAMVRFYDIIYNFVGDKFYESKTDFKSLITKDFKFMMQGSPEVFSPKLITLTNNAIPHPDKNYSLKNKEAIEGNFPQQNNDKGDKCGDWLVISSFKEDKLSSLNLELVKNDKGKSIKSDAVKKSAALSIAKPVLNHRLEYEISKEDLRARFKEKFKDDYGELKHMSPIDLAGEPTINGFNVSAKAKVKPTLSFFKDADMDFGLENGSYTIQSHIKSDQLAKNFPAPFKIDSCNVDISASSEKGLTIGGGLKFNLGNFGTGELKGGMDNGVNLKGDFNFNAKLFKPAKVGFEYANDTWSINGEIGIPDKKIPGIKNAHFTVNYKKGEITATGSAFLNVPGLRRNIDLKARYADGNFELEAETTLDKLPGIKSGTVTVLIRSKEGADIQLRVQGKAIPNLPNVPNLTTELDFLYDNGVFDISTKVQYSKGRFSGEIQAGVTNQALDDKGKPVGKPDDAHPVIYGYGKLEAVIFKDNKGTVEVRLTPKGDVLVAGQIQICDIKPFGEGYNFKEDLLKFPTIKLPLAGIPGISLSAEIDGGVFFTFNWQPLVLKLLQLDLVETDIKHLDTAQLNITGSVGSMARAEVYMAINVGLEAQALIAKLTGKIGGEAGVSVEAEAGGDLKANWSADHGLQFEEIQAHINVMPKAMFRLTGSVSVDLDLWIKTINLYYHQWIFAEKSLDINGLSLIVDFPIKFDKDNGIIMPDLKSMQVQKPEFSGEKGKQILDNALNGDAKKEEEAKRQKITEQIKNDLRNTTNKPDFTPTKYVEEMTEKYEKNPELQQFVLDTIEKESKNLEYEKFENKKSEIRNADIPLENKMAMVEVYAMFNSFIADADIEAFRNELIKTEEAKIAAIKQLNELKQLTDKIVAENEAKKNRKKAPARGRKRKARKEKKKKE